MDKMKVMTEVRAAIILLILSSLPLTPYASLSSLSLSSLGGRHFEPAGGVESSLPAMIVEDWRRDLLVPEDAKRLSLQMYRSLEDGVVFDWFISLYDKDQMASCDVFYTLANDTDGHSGIRMSPFMPARRTFVIGGLRADSVYHFLMLCRDRHQAVYATENLTVATGGVGSGQARRVEQQLRHPRHGDHLLDAVKFAASAPNGNFGQHNKETKKKKKDSFDLRRELRRRNISPHAVLGTACLALGLLIGLITTVLVVGRHWRSQVGVRQHCSVVDSNELLNNSVAGNNMAFTTDVCIGSVRQYVEVNVLEMRNVSMCPSINESRENLANDTLSTENDGLIHGLDPRTLLRPQHHRGELQQHTMNIHQDQQHPL